MSFWVKKFSVPSAFLLVFLLWCGCSVSADGHSSDGGLFPQCPKPSNLSVQRPRLGSGVMPISEVMEKASSPKADEEMNSALNDFFYRWFYGPGLGVSSLNIGTVVLFPPYALYLLGNGAAALAGYEPLSPISYIPGETGDYVRAGYDAITGSPGRLTSGIAGEPFQGEDPCIP